MVILMIESGQACAEMRASVTYDYRAREQWRRRQVTTKLRCRQLKKSEEEIISKQCVSMLMEIRYAIVGLLSKVSRLNFGTTHQT